LFVKRPRENRSQGRFTLAAPVAVQKVPLPYVKDSNMKPRSYLLFVALSTAFLIAGCSKSQPSAPLPVGKTNEAAVQKMTPKGNPKKPVLTGVE